MIARLLPFLLLAACLLCPLAPANTRASDLESFPGCEFQPTDWADGDSFLVRFPDGDSRVVRLYYVDCIETSVSTDSDRRRLREQARYFGVEDVRAVVDYGREATRRTASLLEEPFTVHTAFADARGRSGKPRVYGFVTTNAGRDLARLLVEDGLARAHGIGRETPTGTHRDDWTAYLEDLELVAAIRRLGVWEHSDPEAIVAMREQERADMRALESIDDALSIRPPAEPVDLNTASLEDLMRTGLRESLDDATIRMRPFESVDDLIEVRGIGPVTLEKVRPHVRVATPADSSAPRLE